MGVLRAGRGESGYFDREQHAVKGSLDASGSERASHYRGQLQCRAT